MIDKNNFLQMRPSWLAIDLAAIQHNAKAIMQHAGAQRLIAVVKADAYGHGAVPVTEALYEIGVRDFAVATIAEGITLRTQVMHDDFNIVLLGVQDVQHVRVMAAHRLTPAVGTLAWLDEAAAHLDINARKRLFDELGAVDAQVWATGLEPEVFESCKNALFVACKDGEIFNILKP